MEREARRPCSQSRSRPAATDNLRASIAVAVLVLQVVAEHK